MSTWRNRYTCTFEGRVGQPVRVQVPPSTPFIRSMKKTRINNEISTDSKSTIVTFSIACIALLFLCIFFTYIFVTYRMASDSESQISLILILASLFITLILFLVLTITRIKRRNDELYNCQYKAIRYVEFCKEGITVGYSDKERSNILYENIDSLDLKLKTETTCSYRSTSFIMPAGYRYIGVTGFDLKIRYNDNEVSKSITVKHPSCFTTMDKIFEIVHFSQYISNFSYKCSRQNETELKNTLGKAIESYIANNYKHTLRSFGYTVWSIPVLIITVILLFIVLFLVGYLIVIGVI